MEEDLMHELAAAYALDALGPDEEQEFERHLSRCSRCQAEVASFAETAAALAYAAPAAARPSALRTRILSAAAEERTRAVPLRPRWAYPAVAAAAVAACAAIGLGVWGNGLHSQLSHGQALRALALHGAQGSVVVGRDGEAALVVSGLEPAPAGKTYEMWVLRGSSAEPAGLFAARTATATVRLSRRLASGERVGVTLEPAGGSPKPTEAPLFVSAFA